MRETWWLRKYHKDIGHTTKEYIQLKKDIENPIQLGHFRIFIQKDAGKQPDRPDKSQDGNDNLVGEEQDVILTI